MMRVALLEDEPLARDGVRARLAGHDDVALVAEFHDGEAALAGLAAAGADLVFVDVQLPGPSGLEVLAALPQAARPLAILLTAYDQFAVRAFELEALDYLLKPIDDERFAEALERARRALRQRASVAASQQEAAPAHQERFAVRCGSRLVFVSAAEVDWIAADGGYAALHVGTAVHLVREPLHLLARRLDPARFVRVHRSAIVRIDQVAELRPLVNRDVMLRLRDGTPLRASRTYAEALMARLRGRPPGA